MADFVTEAAEDSCAGCFGFLIAILTIPVAALVVFLTDYSFGPMPLLGYGAIILACFIYLMVVAVASADWAEATYALLAIGAAILLVLGGIAAIASFTDQTRLDRFLRCTGGDFPVHPQYTGVDVDPDRWYQRLRETYAIEWDRATCDGAGLSSLGPTPGRRGSLTGHGPDGSEYRAELVFDDVDTNPSWFDTDRRTQAQLECVGPADPDDGFVLACVSELGVDTLTTAVEEKLPTLPTELDEDIEFHLDGLGDLTVSIDAPDQDTVRILVHQDDG